MPPFGSPAAGPGYGWVHGEGAANGKIIEYHVNVKLAFVIEGAEIEKP